MIARGMRDLIVLGGDMVDVVIVHMQGLLALTADDPVLIMVQPAAQLMKGTLVHLMIGEGALFHLMTDTGALMMGGTRVPSMVDTAGRHDSMSVLAFLACAFCNFSFLNLLLQPVTS